MFTNLPVKWPPFAAPAQPLDPGRGRDTPAHSSTRGNRPRPEKETPATGIRRTVTVGWAFRRSPTAPAGTMNLASVAV